MCVCMCVLEEEIRRNMQSPHSSFAKTPWQLSSLAALQLELLKKLCNHFFLSLLTAFRAVI